MADYMGLGYSQMMAKANEVGTIKTNFDTERTKLESVIMSLDEVWKGDSQTAFVEKYQQLKPSLAALSDILEEYQGDIMYTANKFKEADEEAAAKNRNN